MTLLLFLGVTSLQAQSNELIRQTERVARLDAALNKGLFNNDSQKLDIVLFGYYHDAYRKKRDEINQSSGGSNGGADLPDQLSNYQEQLEESIALWKMIKRVTPN